MTLSTADRFRHLAEVAAAARARGDYGIAAAYVVRSQGQERTYVGRNSLFSDRDPTGHAEVNALRLARRSDSTVGESGRVFEREALGEVDETILFATLEPCPMCTVAAINARVDRIVVAIRDPPAGSLEQTRLSGLPPLWRELARSIEVIFCQSDRPDDRITYLPPELSSSLATLFHESRGGLDETLAESGAFASRKG